MKNLLIFLSLSLLSASSYAAIPASLHGSWSGTMNYVYFDQANSQYYSGTENYDLLTVTTDKFNLSVNTGGTNPWTEEEFFETSNNNPPMNTYIVKKEYINGSFTDTADMTGYCSVDFCNISYRSGQNSNSTAPVRTYDLTYQLMSPSTLKVTGKRVTGNTLSLRWEAVLTKQP